MPNWIEQVLHVVGSKSDVDRFVRTGFSRQAKDRIDDLLDLRRLCPLKRGEPKNTYTHDSAVVLLHFRTRTQAFFSMMTGWDYPAEFYARLAIHWPSLAFACTVNGEMGDFGGIIVVLDGKVVNLVQDYGVRGYSRRAQARQIRRALDRWGDVLDLGRDWRLLAHEPWEHKSMPFDAHFDDDFWFSFRTREEMMRFKARYRGAMPQRRVDGVWKRTR